jgi:hypothetical protein
VGWGSNRYELLVRLLRNHEAIGYKPRLPRSRKLDPFKRYVAERLRAALPQRRDSDRWQLGLGYRAVIVPPAA